MAIRFEIPGDPIALKRHRHTKAGISYDPSKNDKADFLAKCMEHRPEKPMDCAIGLKVIFCFRRPQSHFGTGKNAGRLKDSAPRYHTKRPDLDNLVKFVEDALQGVFFVDDKQVVYTEIKKIYHDYAKVVIGMVKMSEFDKETDD